ncbi:MAG: DNA methyltransferase [Rhizomicrobium sp.]
MKAAQRKNADESWLNRAIIDEAWDYAESDTQALTHNIHRYSGKFIPQIAARVIRMLSEPKDFILDPYCGSGTVLVEAALADRRALGIDLNPLAVLIAQTKIAPVPRQALVNLQRQMSEVVAGLGNDDMPSLFTSLSAEINSALRRDKNKRLSDPWFCKWFQPKVLQDLVVIESEIEKLDDARLRNVALVVFSDVLRKSSNAHSGYPNIMFDRKAPKKPRPGKPFLRALERVCSMIAMLSEDPADWSKVAAKHGTAIETGVHPNSVDLIVTHPPYIGSIPYAEYGALSLKWLGHDPKALDRALTGGRRQARDVVQRFRESYAHMLEEAYRVLRHGKYAFLMVGNPVVRGEVVDLATMTIDLAERADFRLVASTERRAVNRRANKMGGEHLLFFQKSETANKTLRSAA